MDEYRPMTGRSQVDGSTPFGGQRPSSRKSDGFPMPAAPSTARGRPDTSMVNDPQRPVSKIARLQSAARPGTSIMSTRQGSAFRGGTARPPSSMSGAGGGTFPLHAQVNIMDRPMTQQGVSGVRTARTSYGNRRMVHDKTYFLGLLHTKMGEITTEIHRLNTSVESLGKEQSTYLSYDKRVKELASELTEMQGEFQDYNVLCDTIVSGKDKSYIEEGFKATTRDNKVLSQKIEAIYNRRREAEKQVHDLELKIEEERSKSETLVQSLSDDLRDRYDQIREESTRIQEEMRVAQNELDDLQNRRRELYDKLCTSDLKREAAELEEELLEITEKRDELLRDSTSRETPEEERERLLHQVKVDNMEITTLERQMTELADELRLADEELKGIEQEIDETDSDRQQKLKDLKKRDMEMDQFISTFEETKANEMQNLAKLEASIRLLMEKITRNNQLAAALPETGISAQSFSDLKEDLEYKEEEFDKAKYTTEMIELKNETLRKQLEDFENLEEKMKSELETNEISMKEMQREMITFQDTEKVKLEADEKATRLKKETQILEERMKGLTSLLKATEAEHASIQDALNKNDVHNALHSMEKKWRALEQVNFDLLTYINAKKTETNYEDVKSVAIGLLQDLNTLLQNKNMASSL